MDPIPPLLIFTCCCPLQAPVPSVPGLLAVYFPPRFFRDVCIYHISRISVRRDLYAFPGVQPSSYILLSLLRSIAGAQGTDGMHHPGAVFLRMFLSITFSLLYKFHVHYTSHTP